MHQRPGLSPHGLTHAPQILSLLSFPHLPPISSGEPNIPSKTLASHMSDFLGPGLLDSALAPSAGLWARTRLLIWMPPSSSSACSPWPGLSPFAAPWGRGACRTSVQKRVRGPWSSQK